MRGPLLGPGEEDITWPDQVAPRGRKSSSTRKMKSQTSNPSCGKPSSLSCTSARVAPVNLEISGREVTIRLSLFPTVPTVFSTWTIQRCLSSGAMTLP